MKAATTYIRSLNLYGKRQLEILILKVTEPQIYGIPGKKKMNKIVRFIVKKTANEIKKDWRESF